MEMVRKGGPAQLTNTLEGLELHKSVLSDAEQLRMEQRIQEWVHLGLQVKPLTHPGSRSFYHVPVCL